MKANGKKLTLRVIAGSLKGRPIAMVPSDTTRSTKSILKESFFNTLGIEVEGTLFVEVFAGTGSMGIEALSRGARRAIFFEYSNEAYKILQKNLQTLSLQEASESFLGNSFDLFPQTMRSQSQKEKMIVYLDPPFAIRENQAEVYERCYALIQTLSPQNTLYIALEHMSQLEPPSQIGAFERLKTKKFGKSALSYYATLAHD